MVDAIHPKIRRLLLKNKNKNFSLFDAFFLHFQPFLLLYFIHAPITVKITPIPPIWFNISIIIFIIVTPLVYLKKVTKPLHPPAFHLYSHHYHFHNIWMFNHQHTTKYHLLFDLRLLGDKILCRVFYMITYDNWGKPFPQVFPQIPPKSNDKIRYFTIIYEFSLQLQKPLENAHFLSFSRGLTSILSRN